MSGLDLSARPMLAPGVRLKMDRVSGEPVLLFPEGLLVLNETAHEIAQRCDGARSIAALVSQLTAEFDADVATLQADVLSTLGDLRARNLLVFAP